MVNLNRDFFSILNMYIDKEIALYWRGSLINKIEVSNKSKSWSIYVKLVQPLKAELVDLTASHLLKAWPFLKQINLWPLLNYQEKCVDNLIEKCRKQMTSNYATLSQLAIKWNLNERGLDLIAEQEEDYAYILEIKLCDEIAAWLWQQYRLQCIVRTVLDKDQIVSDRKPLLRQAVKKLDLVDLPAQELPKRNKKKNNRKVITAQELNQYPILALKDLQEGMKSAVIEGEIWDKETSELKDGRYLITYYLTDYSDTIIVKNFIEAPEDDKIHTGDWIKIMGSVRYDNYLKELVVYLEGFDIKEKDIRLDRQDIKRIEFHAHTKMSAMDGLTDVKKLIKRAAQWKHEAIAITDHGCVQAFPEAYQAGKELGIKIIYGLEAYLVENEKKERPYHIVLLAQNLTGLKNLYKLVSKSYLNYFYRHPKIPRKVLIENREGILIGTACQAGELYQAILAGKSEAELLEIASFYDYLEIQPLANNEFLIRENKVKNLEQLQNINELILKLGRKLNKAVIATGDVHFLDPEDRLYRTIIQSGQGYDDLESESELYFKNTEEMLEEFAYLGEKAAREVVIDYPQQINQAIENIKPVPDGFYPPEIDTAAEEITSLTWEKANELYGINLPEIVEQRIKHELNSITEHGFSVLYLIAHKLVVKSNQDGYLVGSRGSVGSSLVAYLTGITEVNPLQPHYLCKKCKTSIFSEDNSIECGVDLADRDCPNCGSLMEKEGFNIPFETFLGFEGDKVPDIDLNFSGDYQVHAHHYVEELFGSENVFRAGTISTIAEKTAFGFVKKYAEEKSLNISNAEIRRLVKGITGVRRTTGQHPGGLIVVPKGHDIHEFTPLQHPADKKDSGVITTHFEYHAIGDQLVKLDILGHDDPTVIRELERLTGVKASQIKLDDPDTMKVFSQVEILGIKKEDINSSVGTFGIPEFGTRFVRQMLEATRPTTFAELVRISGLSHGTDVWLNNAQELIESGTAQLNKVICTRDDIMTYLINMNMNKKTAFNIMERVRKGKGLTENDINAMTECSVPEWYINSCQKIKYMFPRAHAVAYVTMAFRIAYYKVNYPLAFYASFFSIRAEDFDAQIILDGAESLDLKIKDIYKMGNSATQKDKKLVIILELAQEMYARGFKFYSVDIYRSEASKFKIYKDGLLLPFSALPNVGLNAALGIVEARKSRPFVSVEDFQNRTHLNKTAMSVLRQYNCFKNLPESNQINLFA